MKLCDRVQERAVRPQDFSAFVPAEGHTLAKGRAGVSWRHESGHVLAASVHVCAAAGIHTHMYIRQRQIQVREFENGRLLAASIDMPSEACCKSIAVSNLRASTVRGEHREACQGFLTFIRIERSRGVLARPEMDVAVCDVDGREGKARVDRRVSYRALDQRDVASAAMQQPDSRSSVEGAEARARETRRGPKVRRTGSGTPFPAACACCPRSV